MRSPTQKRMAVAGFAITRNGVRYVVSHSGKVLRPVVWKRETVTCEPRGAA